MFYKYFCCCFWYGNQKKHTDYDSNQDIESMNVRITEMNNESFSSNNTNITT